MGKIIEVKVVPGAKVEQIQESLGGGIKVWVKRQPKDGEANRSLVRLLAKCYNKPVSDVKIVKGLTSRNKIIHISD